jgi:lipopolysaccharide/colanic/teichoic acid biosynthesis glycosyltransferase
VAKRALDLTAAVVGLIVLAPVLLIVSFMIKFSSPGPVFFKGERIGKGNVPFKMFKFRTMVVNASTMGPALTHSGDPRITRVGRFLRASKIDEIPQLINVLKGDMSLVGPRPESPGYVAYYTPDQQRVLAVHPGITGVSQIRFRHEERLLSQSADFETDYIKKIMPQKLDLDLEYIESRSFALDIKLILETLLSLFRPADRSAPEAGD